MADVGLRFNLENEEVELTVDGEVAFASGSDVFKSWVDAYNEKHPLEPVTVEVPVPAQPVQPEEPVEEKESEQTEVVEEVDNNEED